MHGCPPCAALSCCTLRPFLAALRCLLGRRQERPSCGCVVDGVMPLVFRLSSPPPSPHLTSHLQVRAELEDEEMMQKRKMLEATDALVSEYKKQMEVRAGGGGGGGCGGRGGRRTLPLL